MSAVAGRTGALGAVRIDAADTRVRPGGWVQCAVATHLDFRAVALIAAGGLHRGTGQLMRQCRHALGDQGVGLGMHRTGLLPILDLVAATTVLRRDNGRYHLPLVLDRIGFRSIRPMAIHAIDPGALVRALMPLPGESGRCFVMTTDTARPCRMAPAARVKGYLGSATDIADGQ